MSVLLSLRGLQEFDTTCTNSTACAKYGNLAMNTRAEVEKASAGTDTSDLRVSFRRALSFSIPPLAVYRNYRPGVYSDLIFGVPMVDLETSDNVPKIMRMCIEEVEKRGLNTNKIYSVSRSRHVLGPMFSVAGGFYIRRRSTTGQWNAPK